MTGKGLLSGLKSYVGALLTVLLFPIFWMRALKLARRHSDVDPRGVAKVGIAIVLSIVILAGGAFVLVGFQEKAEHTMYVKTLDQRVAVAVGEKEVRDNEEAVKAATSTITTAKEGIADALATYAENRTSLVDDEPQATRLGALEALWADLRTLDAIEEAAVDALPLSDQDALHNVTTKATTGLNHLEEAAALNEASIAATATQVDKDRATAAELESISNRTAEQQAQLHEVQANILRGEAKLAGLETERASLLSRITQARSDLLARTAAATSSAGRTTEWNALRASIASQARALGLDQASTDSGQSLVTVLRDDFLATLNAVAANEAASEASAPQAKSALAETTRAFSLATAIDRSRADSARAAYRIQVLVENRELYDSLAGAIENEDDGQIRRLVAQAELAYPPQMAANVDDALAKKDAAVRDMHLSMWLFVWPSLAGAFLAPVVFAVSSILSKAFVPSDTVGYKPYPGAAAGLFLLFGAFGVPSIPFAAWTYLDLEARSREGQIAL